jgi:hypothetical protein
MKHSELRTENENLIRETMHIACIYGWISRGWDQQRYGCKIDKSPFPDSADLVADQMEASRIYHSMAQQGKPISNWLFYAYGDDHAPDCPWHARQVAYQIWRRHELQDQKHYDVSWFAVQEFKNRVLGRPASGEEVIYTGLDVKQWEWRKTWKQKYDDSLDQIQAWDRHGVAHVSIVIREIKDGRKAA